MTEYFPPIEDTTIFNSSNFTDKTLSNEIEELTPYFLRYPIAQGTQTLKNTNIIGELFVNSTTTAEINAGSELKLGTNTPTISIGGPSTNTTIYGDTTYVNTTNLDVKDANILMNKSGLTPTGAGIQIESSNSVVSSLLNNSSADWVLSSTNNKLYLDEIAEKTTGHNILFSSDISMNGNDINNISSLNGQNNINMTIQGQGTADLIFQTNGFTRLTIDDSGISTFNSLPVCSSVPTSGSQLTNKTYVDSVVGGASTLSSVLISGNNAGTNSINMNNQNITNVNTISGTGTSNLVISNSSTGDIVFQTNGATRLYVDNGGSTVFNTLPVCTVVPTSGSQLVNKTYVDGNIPTLSQVLTAGNSAGLTNINMNNNIIENVTGVTASASQNINIQQQGTGIIKIQNSSSTNLINVTQSQVLSVGTVNVNTTSGNGSTTIGNSGGTDTVTANGKVYLSRPTSSNNKLIVGTEPTVNIPEGCPMYINNATYSDTTVNGSLSGSVYPQYTFGTRLWNFAQDTADDLTMFLGCSGGGGVDSDYEYFFKRNVGLQIQPNKTGNTTSFSEALSVIGSVKNTGTHLNTNLTQSTNDTTGALVVAGGIASSSQINSKYGIGFGEDGINGGVISNTDNYTGGFFSSVNYSASPYLPRGFIPRMMRFMMAKPLTAGTATTVLTLTHTAVATEECSFSISFRGIVHGSTTSDVSSRNQGMLISGARANGAAFTMAATVPATSLLVSTNAVNLALGGITFTFPVNTTTSTSIAINQAVTTGTPSQALFITGEWELYQTTSNGGLFLTGIS